MRLIFTSYVSSPEFVKPDTWLERINGYTGILEALSSRHEVIGIERINYRGEHVHKGVRYYFIKFRKKVAVFPRRMHLLIKRLNPDVVFINGFIFPLQIIQLRLALGKNVKIVVLHRAEKPFKGLKKYLQKLANKGVNAYLFTSAEFGKEWMEQGIISDQNKIYEIIQGSSVFFPGNKHESKNRRYVTGIPVYLWVGRLDSNKDPLTVVKAFIAFLEYQPGARLYMIYHTDELLAEITHLIEMSNKTGQSIQLIGKRPHHELQDWFNSADFIISGSHYEGSGIAVTEAMSCGCIPILTDIISFRKMTGPGKCGLLYEPGNVRALLSALLQTRNMDIKKESTRTIQQFKEELSFEAIAEKIDSMIADS